MLSSSSSAFARPRIHGSIRVRLSFQPSECPRSLKTWLPRVGGLKQRANSIRPAGEFKMALATGIDWFELDGGIQYGDQNVSLPELLGGCPAR